MQTDDATIRIKPIDGVWESIGSDRNAGVWFEELTCSSVDPGGPDTASFVLKRDPIILFPDLLPFTSIEIEIDGTVKWDGFVWETPTTEGPGQQISVQCRGWQYHLDDDVSWKRYVHTDLSAWQDRRDELTTAVGTGASCAAGQVNNDGGLMLMFPKDYASTLNDEVGVMLDMGPNNVANRLVFSGTTSANNNGTPFLQVTIYAGNNADGSGSSVIYGGAALTTMGASFSNFTANPGGKRYIFIQLKFTTAGTTAADGWVKFSSIQVFADSTYESGNASVLKVPTVVKDVLTNAASKISSNQSYIDRAGAASFNIPAFSPDDYMTPREIITALNIFESFRWRLIPGAIFSMDTYPTAALYEIGAWSGSNFQDASANQGEDIYTRCIITGTDPAGVPLKVIRTQSGATVPSRAGFTRTKVVPVQNRINTTAANRIGDLWLASHKTAPFRGSMSVASGIGIRRIPAGSPVHPSELLQAVGELVRVGHRTDPDTGATTRDGRIARVDYDHNSRTSSVSLDNSRKAFDTILARYGARLGGL